jgi:hypothetical protein
MITTADKLKQLEALRDQAGSLAFERVRLASEVIKDKDWIVKNYEGSEMKAAKALELRYFADLCGAINFWELIEILNYFPTLEKWQEYQFNLAAMCATIEKGRKKVSKIINRVTLAAHEELIMRLAVVETQLKEEQQRREEAEGKLLKAEGQLTIAVREIAQLKGQLAKFEIKKQSA